ncbi:MAG TPA: arylamine N-acetyltransferase [Pyrinomonadaceae bacterium]|nr:arylamine N-acetyltransferase [Pyrinomonadaceae bacterium]
MNISAYLERINYHGPTTPSTETLRALQFAHLLTVPFENLSIHAGEPIVLDDSALFTKIVDRHRGGFCYEVNGLFAALLRALGFDVSMLSAEVANASGVFSQPFDHMTLMVQLDQRWLVDVGFGDSFLEPLLLDDTKEQPRREDVYRIENDGDFFILLRREMNEWRSQYRFTLQPHVYDDYAEMCNYHQTSPQSHFTQKRICSLPTDSGRITISDMRWIETSSVMGRLERTLESAAEYSAVLRERFGIVILR